MNPNNPYQPNTPPPQTPPPSGGALYTPPASGYQPPQYGSTGAYGQPGQPLGYDSPQQQPTPPPVQPQYNPYQPQPYNPAPRQPISSTPPDLTPPPRPKRYDKLPLPIRMMDWAKKNWWAPALGVLVLLIVGDIIYQMTYPMNALPPGTMVDGQNVGKMERQEAVTALNNAYGKIKTDIYFGSSTVPYKTPEARELGIQVDNSERLEGVSYPVWLRFVPTSIMWASSLNKIGDPLYNYDKATLDTYVLRELGADCTIKPQNASLKLDDNRFVPVASVPGGKCNVTDFKDRVAETRYKDGKMSVRTDISEVPAPVTEDMAKDLADTLNKNLENDMPLIVKGKKQTVPNSIVKSWLSFKAIVPEPSDEEGGVVPPPRIAYVIEHDRVRTYFDRDIARSVEKKPGTTKISTTDFTENSRTEGAPGVLINMKTTVASINRFVAAKSKQAKVTVGPVPAIVEYTRKYTPSEVGMRALIEQFSHDNEGRIAIVMQEESAKDPLLGGTARENEIFQGAGIEGAYVAYAAQVGIDDGSIQPTDTVIGSSSVEDCIEAAIKVQSKDCVDALLQKVGNPVVQQRIQALGMHSTSFSGRVTTTTARDAYTFMSKVRSKDLPLKNKNKLEVPMRNITMRDGMIQTARSAAIIGGESGRFYNEAGIISYKGLYHIAVLSENSEGAKMVSKLMKDIEKLRKERLELKS